MTISVDRCRDLTTGNCNNCEKCLRTQVCCGEDVCIGGSSGACGFFSAQILKTAPGDPNRQERLIVPNCSGGFVSLKTLLEQKDQHVPAG